MSLGNCHFATDKNTFYIREIASLRVAISGYIIGVLKVQRFKQLIIIHTQNNLSNKYIVW
jgi:hypothetical protein